MKNIICPACKGSTHLKSSEETYTSCSQCGRRLSIFSPLIYGLGCLLGLPLFLFGRYMMVDVVGGLLESPGGVVLEREQLEFIMVAGKYAAVACAIGAIALFLFAIVLRVLRGTFLLIRVAK